MTSKSTTASNRREIVTVAAAFVFLVGVLFFWTSFMIAAGLLLFLRLSIFLVDLTVSSPGDLHKHRSGVRYSR